LSLACRVDLRGIGECPRLYWLFLSLLSFILPFGYDNYTPRGAPNRAYDFRRTRLSGWVLCTLPRQISSCLPRGAPAKCYHRRHLLSSLNPFIGVSLDLPWRSFTLSQPLQTGLWLLRRLRPLCCVLHSRTLFSQVSSVRVPQFRRKQRSSDP
jgi:hypothetical protein